MFLFQHPFNSTLFHSQDFTVLDVRENYMGQFLSIEAAISSAAEHQLPEIDVESVGGLVDKFANSFEQKITLWKEKLDELHALDKKIVVWGGGSKGVTFLNFLKTADKIKNIVDINPSKSGMFVAGTGQKYILPRELKQIRPDTVIVMNPIYKHEITSELKQMGMRPEILVA